MPGTVSQERSARSSLGWKATAVLFIILTIGASGFAYYYYGQTQTKISGDASLNSQIQQLQSWLNGNKTSIDKLRGQLDRLGKLNATHTVELQELNSQIADLQTKVASIQTQYATLLAQNSSLTDENNVLTAEVSGLQIALHSLVLEVGNLTQIVFMQVVQVVASSVSLNRAACGDSGQLSCNKNPYILPTNFLSFCSPTCYAGLLNVTWTSTQPLSVSFTFSASNSGVTTSKTESTSSGNFTIPIPGSFSTIIVSSGFHIDSCTTDIFSNVHCPQVSMTYSETFVY